MDWTGFYGLAIFAALYPVVLAIVALMLPRPRPAVLLAGMLTGGFLTTVISGVVIVSIVGATNVLSSHPRTVAPVVNIAIGAFLLVAAVVLLRRPRKLGRPGRREREAPEPPEKEKTSGWAARAGKANSFWGALVIGIAVDLPSVWYLAALKYLDDANFAIAIDFLLIVSYALIAYIFVELPLLFNLKWPQQTQRVVQSANDWVKAHKQLIEGAIAGVIGIWQLATGISKLA
jgi:Sap, sulfolipid-1-addressing protein